ncbi:hypothetical protein AYK20_03945 [Thermoplasmatales archaeon SG8-52-1]|nr:MAG: hypothetical protein AYK20_03945 [Thermoplasmatales archaeon SG8-52-1]
MNKKLKIVVTIIIVISISSFFNLNEKTIVISDSITNNILTYDKVESLENIYQDGRFIKKLQWYSPDGKNPGKYEEYLKINPLKSAFFSQPINYYTNLQSNAEKISILIDQVLYFLILTELNQYIDDLNAEGYIVTVQKVTDGSPEEIKQWLIEQYTEGCSGFIFIGDITTAWAEVSGDVFPCDLFYMDLDGNWEDRDDDGDYEIHTSGNGDMGPEVFVGRIYSSTLNYASESNLVNDYLNKVHLYRTGQLKQPWCSLEYVEEDWYDMDVFLRYIYGENVIRDDSGFNTTAQGYLDNLDLGHHFVQVCAHSYSGGHHFGTRPTKSVSYSHVYIYSPTSRSAKLLLGCDDGIKVWLNDINVYTNDRYGGWYPDEFEVDVSLTSGWNHLLCKISQGGGDYLFSARFTDTNYNTFDDLIYQIKNPDISSEEGQFIRSWLLNGFHQDIPDNFWYYLTTNYLGVEESMINPEEGEVMGGKIWTCYDSGNPYINMREFCNNADYGACYAFVRVHASKTISCQLWMGYDDGTRAWLNGDEILYDNRYGDFEADMNKINVTLQSGENRLLVKISQWMGEHGFSARFCQFDGSKVDGLFYDPEPIPINYIGTWLNNGPYYNTDESTRLSYDYLGDETNVTPNEGDPAPFGTWDRGIGEGYPYNIGEFYNHGGWVLSEDIQNRDPPVLFYNLFACGPGRFTDENYLAGAYIFNTSYGLITVASSKSGSMLNFDDFTEPLSQQKCIGKAFQDWFDAQSPFVQWEKEWYYGMVVCGDPMLFIINNSHPTKPSINGPLEGKVRTKYQYSFKAHDSEEDKIYYFIDWGDQTNTGWMGPYSSGQEVKIEHTWKLKGEYTIKARAKDNNNLLSPWGTFEITMPRTKTYNLFLLQFLKQFPNAFPILKYMLEIKI